MGLYKKTIRHKTTEYKGVSYTEKIVSYFLLGVLIRKKVFFSEEKLPKKVSIERWGQILSVGDRVIVRSNEPDGLMIGHIKEFDDFSGKKYDCPLPIVIDEKDGKDYLVFGLIIKYDSEVEKFLLTLRPIEQYNYMIAKYAPHGKQLESKYGIKYQTF